MAAGNRPDRLDLREGCTDHPTRVDLDVIAAIMLWPHDQRARERAAQTSEVAHLQSLSSMTPPLDATQLTLSQQYLLAVLRKAADATPLSMLQEEMKDNFYRGVRAGLYLRQTIRLAQLSGQAPAMKQVVRDVCSTVLDGAHGRAINLHTFQNHIWPTYRCVSHFWAATLDFAPPGPFPCQLRNFCRFLARAEGYKHMGRETRGRQASRAILKEGETIELPQWFRLRTLPSFERAHQPFPRWMGTVSFCFLRSAFYLGFLPFDARQCVRVRAGGAKCDARYI